MGVGTQNLLCACLAIAVFVVLAANTLLGAWWLDGAVAQGRWLGGRGRPAGLGGTIVRMHIRARHMLLSGTGGGPARPDGPRVYLRSTSRVPPIDLACTWRAIQVRHCPGACSGSMDAALDCRAVPVTLCYCGFS
jgi:hypothetical protein